MAETSKEIPLARITTVHLSQPITHSGTWKRVSEATEGAGQCLEAGDDKYESSEVSRGILLKSGN